MAAPYGQGPARPWTEEERIFLLAELMKQSGASSTHLFHVWLGLNPPAIRWGDVAFPFGRGYNESRQAFDHMQQRANTQSRMPMNVLPQGLNPQTPSPLSAPVTLKRNFPFENINTGREIRPKPSASGNTHGQPGPLEQPPRKKRGRPTKAEIAARAEAQGSTGEPSSATRAIPTGGFGGLPSTASGSASESFEPAMVQPSPTEETRATAPPVSRMPISSIITPTAPTSADSSSSSGRRRRGRSTRSEPENIPAAGTLGERQPSSSTYQSPYAIAGPDPSPARTAIMRHREEPPPPSSPPNETPAMNITQPPTTSSMPEHPRST